MVSLTPWYLGTDSRISKSMAEKIAGSGLTIGHPTCLFDMSGVDGLTELLTSKSSGCVRVTTRKNIIAAIIKYFTDN